MHTPQGVFEMKYFFHSGISSSYGESFVCHHQAADSEDHRERGSAEAAERLQNRQHLQREGLVLARRTIAKYREELKIRPPIRRKVLY